MANLDALGQQLASTEAQLGQYTANLPSEIQTQIQNAYTPALQNSLNTTKQQMGDYLGRYFDTTSMGPGMAGTTAMDLSPTQKLGVMGRELGTMSGELQATQRFSDYLGGQMNDLVAKGQQAAQMGQQNLADQYNRKAQEYSWALQQSEAEKDRAAAAANARASSSGLSEEQIAAILGGQNNAKNNITSTISNIVAERQNGTISNNDFNSAYNEIMNYAKQNQLGINEEGLWQALGNTSANGQTVPLFIN